MEPKTITITVPSSGAKSPIWVGSGILPTLATLLESSRYSKVVVVGDTGVVSLVDRVAQALQVSDSYRLMIQGGERCKGFPVLIHLWESFVNLKLDRASLVVCVGGGALSDLVGFAAATYMRGVAFATIPTTLLAQVDAGIGGKSGINLKGVKNIVGAIAQPVGIVIDIDTIKSLPQREIRSGFAEIVKHGLIADRDYFNLVTGRHCSEWSSEELIEIVFKSCQIKANIVSQDATETGLRKALNFGHSLGHAIEAYSIENEYNLTHGDCVSIGMHAAILISRRLGLLATDSATQAIAGIARAGLPLELPQAIPTEILIELIGRDKKSVSGVTHWTLISEIGSVSVNQRVPTELVTEAIKLIQPQS